MSTAPTVRHHRIDTGGGVHLHVRDAGPEDGAPVLLLHGFPELATSWRHQEAALAAAGYRTLAPDMRGYGASDVPADTAAYGMGALVGDAAGVLDGLGIERAAVVGHDWGALVAWQAALRLPERLTAVAGLSVPHTARGDMRPTELYELFFPDRFFYILYFQQPGVAERELEADLRAFHLRIRWSTSGAQPPVPADPPREGTGYLDSLAAAPAELPAWLPEDHLDELVEAAGRTGLAGALSWYRNLDANWEASADVDQHVHVPAAFITGEHDPLAKLLPASSMDSWVDDLRLSRMLPGVGHWTGEEDPEGVNAALLEFLAGV